MVKDKIFIDRTPEGDFLMRMPAEAIADFYEMITASPLLPRRWFYQVKEHLESKYADEILRTAACKFEREALDHPQMRGSYPRGC